MSEKHPSNVEINVIQWPDGNQEVAVYFHDFDIMLTLTPDSARTLAFVLTECADFVKPPFEEDDAESKLFFGPYEQQLLPPPESEYRSDDPDDDSDFDNEEDS